MQTPTYPVEFEPQTPSNPASEETVSYTSAEEDLWNYMTSPLDELEVVDGQVTIEISPDSVTMLRGKFPL